MEQKFECKLTGEHGFLLLNILQVDGIGEDVIEALSGAIATTETKEKLLVKMKENIALEGKEATQKEIDKYLKDNREFHQMLSDAPYEKEVEGKFLNKLMRLIVLKLPRCKNQIYDLLSQVYGISQEELKKEPLEYLVGRITAIIKCKNFSNVVEMVKSFF